MTKDYKVRQKIVGIHRDQIVNENTSLRLIISDKKDLFIELNPFKHSIRSLSSIIWEPIDEEKYYNILAYLRYFIHRNQDGDIDLSKFDLGSIENNILGISRIELGNFIFYDNFFETSQYWAKLQRTVYLEYKILMENAEKLCLKWDKITMEMLEKLGE